MSTYQNQPLMEAWGRSLKAARESLGLSQYALSQITGLRVPSIWRIEKGQRFPSENTKQLLAGALRRSVPDLFPYSPVPPEFPKSQADVA